MSLPYDVQVPLDGRWLDIPVQGGPVEEDDVQAWAADLVRNASDDRGVGDLTPHARTVLEQAYAVYLDLARGLADEARQVLVTACFVPGVDLLPVVTVNVSAIGWDGPSSGVVDGLVLPEEQRYAAPDVVEIATAAGACTRVRQLVVSGEPEAGSDQLAALATSLTYVWPTPEQGVHLLLDAWFSSPLEAEEFEAEVDAVARGLVLRPVG